MFFDRRRQLRMIHVKNKITFVAVDRIPDSETTHNSKINNQTTTVKKLLLTLWG